MGLFSGIKSAGSQIFNFKVTHWIGLKNLKATTKSLYRTIKNLFTPYQAERTETFEQATTRLNLSIEDLEKRQNEFGRLFLTYFLIGIAIFLYSLYIVIVYGNILGFFMSLSISIYSFSNAFRYHFWLHQIKEKKLGCSLKDWLNAN